MRVATLVPIKIESHVRVEVHEPWGISHVEEQKNLITNEGLFGLTSDPLAGFKLGNNLVNTCILGRRGDAPAVTDTFEGATGFTDLYNPDCPNDPPQALALPPDRSIVASSTANGGVSDVYALVTGGETYWKLTRQRIFEYHQDYFKGSNNDLITGSDLDQAPAWLSQGWGNLVIEASYIEEIGFAAGTVAPTILVRDCVTIVEWQGDALWNRIVLESSLGFESAAPYEVPDVVMSTEAVVQVTLELRLHVDPSENEQEIDIAGETTTVTTRVNDLDNAARWGGTGLLGNLGGWRDDTRAARIGESNTLPGSVNDPMPDAGSELAESAEKLEGGWENRRYHFGPAKGNFPTGTGYLIHGNFSTDTTELSCFVTVFDPKISKTDEDRLEFDIDYSWSRT